MDSWPISADRARAMYASGRADVAARRLARMWAKVFAAGLMPRRWVTLEVTGRRSGRRTRFPLGMARLDGHWYLVPMLGERCNWVQNVRAAHGQVILRHGRAVRCQLTELPVGERPPVLKSYLQQVPGARPHIPVSRDADVGAFTAIAERYPVFLVQPAADSAAPGRAAVAAGRAGLSPRRRRRRRWILGAGAALAVLIVAAVAAAIELGPSAAALRLPPGRVSAPSGQLDGTWHVAGPSLAGFRVQESVLGLHNFVGGQTTAVTGTLVIAHDTVTAARFRVDLAAVKVGGKTQPQFAASLGTRRHPVAVFTLARAVTLSQAFSAGRAVTVAARGELMMNGARRPVTVTLTARRNGPELQAAGSIPVSFARWGIARPAGFGPLGSLASSGEAEFLVLLRR